MFSQVKTALDRSEGGLGIGLALVKGIVELHGGTSKHAAKASGKAANSALTLPSAPGQSRAPRRPGLRVGRAGTHALRVASWWRTTIVMARKAWRCCSDCPATRSPSRTAVARRWNASRELRPDVVVLDIGMPDMNGYAVARRCAASRGRARSN